MSIHESTSDAVASSPSHVFEPVARMIERENPVRRTISITIYRYTGRQGFFTIPAWWCKECDLLVAVVGEAIRELGAEKAVQFRVRPWWLLWFLPLLKGAWHPPILEIAGKVYSQGMVPEKEPLKRYMQSLLI